MHGLPRFGAKLVCQCHGAENLLFAPDQHNGLPAPFATSNFGKRFAGTGTPCSSNNAREPTRMLASDSSHDNPFSGRVTQLRILAQRNIALSGATHDRFAEWMLGMLLGDGSGLEYFLLCRVVDRWHGSYFGNVQESVCRSCPERLCRCG